MAENSKIGGGSDTAMDLKDSLSPRLATSSGPTMLTPSEIESLGRHKKQTLEMLREIHEKRQRQAAVSG